jgi:hypothetical protein
MCYPFSELFVSNAVDQWNPVLTVEEGQTASANVFCLHCVFKSLIGSAQKP